MLFVFLVLKLNSNYAPVALLANSIFQAHITWKLKKKINPDFTFNLFHFKQFILFELSQISTRCVCVPSLMANSISDPYGMIHRGMMVINV